MLHNLTKIVHKSIVQCILDIISREYISHLIIKKKKNVFVKEIKSTHVLMHNGCVEEIIKTSLRISNVVFRSRNSQDRQYQDHKKSDKKRQVMVDRMLHSKPKID